MKTRKPLLFAAVAAMAAFAICQMAAPRPYVEQLIRVQTAEGLAQIDPRILDEPIEVQGVLLDYGANRELVQKAWIALSKYPKSAREILLLYGSAPEFQEVLLSYGEAVIPVVQYFRENDVWTVNAMETARNVYERGVGSCRELDWKRARRSVSRCNRARTIAGADFPARTCRGPARLVRGQPDQAGGP